MNLKIILTLVLLASSTPAVADDVFYFSFVGDHYVNGTLEPNYVLFLTTCSTIPNLQLTRSIWTS